MRRAFGRMDESQGVDRLENHLQHCYEALLNLPWIIEGDTTVKPLYGNQEGLSGGLQSEETRTAV